MKHIDHYEIEFRRHDGGWEHIDGRRLARQIDRQFDGHLI